MQVQTPYLPLPIEVRGIGPYHVEQHGCVVMICDKNGHNSVSFNFVHADVLAENGMEVSPELLERIPVFSTNCLRNDRVDHIKLCDDVAAYLDQQPQ